MGWEDNDFDWMDDSGYSSDGGMDFGDTSDYTNNLDVTTDDWSGAWSGFGNNDYSSGDWDYGYTPNYNQGSGGNIDYSGSGNFYGNSPQFQAMPTLHRIRPTLLVVSHKHFLGYLIIHRH